MRLTTFSDYSLRVLIYLGMQPEGLATIDEIAAAYGISRNHLMKVVHHLARHGYVETVRGKHGGMRLAHRPQSIRVGDVLRTTEDSLALVECFEASGSRCCIAPACVLKGALARALDAFLAVLDGYTLADLLAPGRPLARMLAIDVSRLGARRAHAPVK